MNYQVLARKWRPRFFSEMVGQEHVLKALINALDQGRLHHAYLFTGTRGVGKTTIARILAKCLNCEAGVSSKPCGTCGACVELAEGRFVDLIEVDAASRTKVEDTRDLLDNVQYAPTLGRYKVYLIDEVHMLSGHSFNALLKTLEEPPPHVKFLLATTDPQRLPVTILSRCLQFNLKNLAPERIVEHLTMVLREERVPSDEASLWALARAADGSMRDALSLTDQAIAHGGGQIEEQAVSAMLGTIDRSTVLKICQALATGDGATVLGLVDRLAELAPDYAAALADMIAIWHQVAVAQTVPEALDPRGGNAAEIGQLAAQLTRETVQLFYQICLLGRRDLPHSGDLRVGFEMILLRQLAFEPVPSATDSRGEPAATAAREVPPAAKKSVPAAEVAPAPPRAVGAPAVAPEPELLPELEPEPMPEVPVPPPAVSVPGSAIALEQFGPAQWPMVCGALALGGVVANTAANLELVERVGSRLVFRLDARSDALYDVSHRERIEAALGGYFATPVQVEIASGVLGAESPREVELRRCRERQLAAVATLRADPLVSALMARFNGVLLEDTVVPLDE
ncbi:MAG: DNA polymerase III subunit gamma/tau [Porticoccaceae bacterium]|nr:MAG: DNA polymerase III subunit gamma/tau [Porticoccaceae bacterium]